MSERSLQVARVVSSIAATLISLACGTNYVYSAWGPQFAEKLLLTSTESNIIGVSANLGMYTMGIPIGMFVDSKGPRPALVFGGALLALGYFPLHQAYDKGSGYLPLLCIFSYFTGIGGCAAFAAAVKTSALNWPHHRGTATAFPLAAFGLSAFFFSMFARFVFPGDTGHFLLLLACGTIGLVFVPLFFLRVLPHSHYSALPLGADLLTSDSNRLHRTKSEEARYRAQRAISEPEIEVSQEIDSETSSLLSKTSSSIVDVVPKGNQVKDHSLRVDIRGFKMLPLTEFWQLFSLMGIFTGIGLMTINNIGNDTTALWRHYDDSVTHEFITKQQALHVSILSICNCTGRILSGFGSDLISKTLRASRLWCLVLASLIFLLAQLLALSIQNPHFLFFCSSLTGLAYGFLFGCFPSLIAEAFGIHGLSTNWGFMTFAPVISGNVFNIWYGVVYDRNSVEKGDGRVCEEGVGCYRSAYVMTSMSCVVGLAIALWSIRYTHVRRLEEEKIERELIE